MHGGVEAGAERQLEHVVGLFHQWRLAGGVRVVDQDVEGPEGRDRGVADLGGRGGAGDIDLQEPRIRAEFAFECFTAFGVDVGEQDAGALVNECGGDGAADAGGTAGDDRRFVLQTHGLSCSR